MSRRSICWRHPAQKIVGVCASCLRERLVELACSEVRHGYLVSRHSSAEDNSSGGRSSRSADADAAAYFELDRAKGKGTFLDSQLQRTRSWSHWKGDPNPVRRNRPIHKAAESSSSKDSRSQESRIDIKDGCQIENFRRGHSYSCEEDSLPPLTASASKGHHKASSWPEAVDDSSLPKPSSKSSSWFSSLFKSKGKSKAPSEKSTSSTGKNIFMGLLGRRKSKEDQTTWSSVSVVDIGSDLGKKISKEEAKQKQSGLSNGKKANGLYEEGDSRLSDLMNGFENGNGNGVETEVKVKGLQAEISSADSRRPSNAGSWSKSLSTPLRLFKQTGKPDVHVQDDERVAWALPSPSPAPPEAKRFPPSPAIPSGSSYTAYYRDYGAWSLHSSPMPNGKRRSNKQRRNSREVTHTSPYNASNTWNFYLTPLRPGTSNKSLSKQKA